MGLVWLQADGLHLLVGDRHALLILSLIQPHPYLQSGLGSSATYQVHDRLVTLQGLSLPVQTDVGEHAMLDLVPFAGPRRIMAYGHGQAKFVGKLLQVILPSPTPVGVAPARIGTDE